MKRYNLYWNEDDGNSGKVGPFHPDTILRLVRDILADGGEITGIIDSEKD